MVYKGTASGNSQPRRFTFEKIVYGSADKWFILRTRSGETVKGKISGFVDDEILSLEFNMHVTVDSKGDFNIDPTKPVEEHVPHVDADYIQKLCLRRSFSDAFSADLVNNMLKDAINRLGYDAFERKADVTPSEIIAFQQGEPDAVKALRRVALQSNVISTNPLLVHAILRSPGFFRLPRIYSWIFRRFGESVMHTYSKEEIVRMMLALRHNPFSLFFHKTKLSFPLLVGNDIADVETLAAEPFTKVQKDVIHGYDQVMKWMQDNNETLIPVQKAATYFDPSGLNAAVRNYVREHHILEETGYIQLPGTGGLMDNYYFEGGINAYEKHICNTIRALTSASDEVTELEKAVVRIILNAQHFRWLTADQRMALVRFVLNKVTILDGGPGTGKSEILALASLILASMGLHIRVVAFLGKASINIRERVLRVLRKDNVRESLESIQHLTAHFYKQKRRDVATNAANKNQTLKPNGMLHKAQEESDDEFGDNVSDAAIIEAMAKFEQQQDLSQGAASSSPPTEKEDEDDDVNLLSMLEDAEELTESGAKRKDPPSQPPSPRKRQMLEMSKRPLADVMRELGGSAFKSYPEATEVARGIDEIYDHYKNDNTKDLGQHLPDLRALQSEVQLYRDIVRDDGDKGPSSGLTEASKSGWKTYHAAMQHFQSPVHPKMDQDFDFSSGFGFDVYDCKEIIGGVFVTTIHQMLWESKMYDPQKGIEPPVVDGVLVDEAGVVHLHLMSDTISCARGLSRLGLIGDINQSGPMDLGRPFAEIRRFLYANKLLSRYVATLFENHRVKAAGEDGEVAMEMHENQMRVLARNGRKEAYGFERGWEFIPADDKTYETQIITQFERFRATNFTFVSFTNADVNFANWAIFKHLYPNDAKEAIDEDRTRPFEKGEPILGFCRYRAGMPIIFRRKVVSGNNLFPTGSIKNIRAVFLATSETHERKDKPLKNLKRSPRVMVPADLPSLELSKLDVNSNGTVSQSVFHVAEWLFDDKGNRRTRILTFRLADVLNKKLFSHGVFLFDDGTWLRLQDMSPSDINPGWCMTIKKVQGLEFDNVVWLCPLGAAPTSNPDAYVASTRSMRKLVVLGSWTNASTSIKREPRGGYLQYMGALLQSHNFNHLWVFDCDTTSYRPYRRPDVPDVPDFDRTGRGSAPVEEEEGEEGDSSGLHIDGDY